MIRDTDQWISSVREASLLPDTPIQQTDGRWKVTERLEAWKAVGPRIFDEYLDRLQKVAIEVLRERDPQFDLAPDQRYAASIHGKVLKHSHHLRKGLAETLALLGSYPEYLTSCSLGKAEGTARLAVRAILEGADWELWASLNDVSPLLAEAAPKEFLDAVEDVLNSDPCPFDKIFAQEGPGITGNNYITGLLWALETLAWDEEHLTQVVIILGELAARDPGGNWANRPANSLLTILLPWFPQTMASIAKRVAAVATLQKEQPAVSWKLILNLLPQTHQSSSMTHRPTWRRTIPADWAEGVSNQDYWEQIAAYTEMAISQATQDRSKLATIVDHMNKLPPSARQKLLSHLSSEEVISSPEEERLTIWNELTDFVARHRKYAAAKWALGSDELNQIAAVADHLEPQDPSYKYRRLFIERDFDLYEETDNYVEQAEKLYERRKSAVGEIYSQGGVQAVTKFAELVAAPGQVGFVFGAIASPTDEPRILPDLFESKSSALMQFAASFVLGRFRTKGWQWVDTLNMSEWTSDQKATLLAYLPFTPEAWSRAKRLLADQEGSYWSKTHANPYDPKQEELSFAIDCLVENHRVLAAIGALEKLIYSKGPIDNQQIVRVLSALMQSPDSLRAMDPHAVVQLIKVLQENPDTNRDELFKIEWAFLALLDGSFGVSPILLQKTLANDPAFFCEIIQAVFRSDKDSGTVKETTEEQRAVATNAYRLLMEWRTPPGSQEDGTFDGAALNAWLDKVKTICAESGHLKIAMQQLGEVLFYSPPDPDGLWIHQAVASVLNAKDAGDIRLGYEIETINSRGVHFVDQEGKPERELANHYRMRAEEVEIRGYHRLATTLREVAASYDREAERITSRTHLED
jgi:hypothetical protein